MSGWTKFRDTVTGLVTGSGGSETSGSQSGKFDTSTTQQQSQNQQQTQWQNNQQNQQLQQLANALQQLSGYGQTTQRQQTQYGLAPQDPYAKVAMQGMLQQLLSGGGNFSQMLYNPASTPGAQSSIAGMTQAANDVFNTGTKPLLDTTYTKSGMFGSEPWARAVAQGAGSLGSQLAGQAAGVYGQQQNLGMQGLQGNMSGWNQLAGMGPQAVVTGQYGTGGQQYGQTGGTQTSALGTGLTSGSATGGATGTTNMTGSQTGTGISSGQFSGNQNNFMNPLKGIASLGGFLGGTSGEGSFGNKMQEGGLLSFFM